MPEAAPVTNAVFPARSFMCVPQVSRSVQHRIAPQPLTKPMRAARIGPRFAWPALATSEQLDRRLLNHLFTAGLAFEDWLAWRTRHDMWESTMKFTLTRGR